MNEDISIAPPHAVQAEKAVLSVLMQDRHLIGETDLTEESFYMAGHKILFQRMREAGGPVELVSFVQRLQDQGELESIGGPAAVYEVFGYAPNSFHFPQHREILREKQIRRQAIELANSIEKTAREADSVQDIVSASSEPVTALHDLAAGSRQPKDTKAILSAVLKRLQDIFDGKATPMGISTSLLEINSRFLGMHAGQCIVISGYPGGGKTTLGAQFAMDAAMDGHNTLICSLEMSEEDLMRRCVAYAAHLPGKSVTDPISYSREVWNTEKPVRETLIQIRKAVEKIGQRPFAIENLVGSNVHQITAAIRRAHRRMPLKVAMVDFIQRITATPETRRESTERQLAQASNALADLARELGFCLLLPSQLNKEGAAKHAEAINEAADLHLQIVQDKTTKDHIGIGVIKDRHHGHNGELLPIVLDGPMMRFIPKPPDQSTK